MKMSETGEQVYRRTYSRKLPDGSNETWPQTVRRVVDGNLALVDERYQLPNERDDLIRLITEFKIVPAGRHLWASGVKGAQHLMNCWVSHWTDTPSDHFEFTFMRLMEGGGVGTNYSNSYLSDYPEVQQTGLTVEIVCDPDHPDFADIQTSSMYDSDWDGAFLVEDSREGWAAAMVDLIDTFYRTDQPHKHRVYDVSNVRASGARLKTFGGTASGPAPFARMMHETAEILNAVEGKLTGIDAMNVDHAIAQCVVSGGVRRSARMAMMHWDDPQILDFLTIKQDSGSHWTTNISVVVDDEFWEFVRQDGTHALNVLESIAGGMHSNGEPGFFDISYANQGEPDEVVSSNPCSEICLNAWEPCNLGHVNLAAFAHAETDLSLAHRLMTRFLIRATFAQVSDPKSRSVLDRNRRIGVGHLGVASYLAINGVRYSDGPETAEFTDRLKALAYETEHAAIEFAHELRIPIPVKIRTVAPTGTIAKMPGVSEGIHPIFSKYFIRRIRFSNVDEDQRAQLDDYRRRGFDVEPCQYAANTSVVSIPTKDTLVASVAEYFGESEADQLVQGTDDLTLDEMLRFQAMYQQVWADNAVSYTANFDPAEYSVDEIASLLRKYGGKLKGTTVFPEISMPQSPYERLTREQYELYQAVDVADGVDEECASGVGCPIR